MDSKVVSYGVYHLWDSDTGHSLCGRVPKNKKTQWRRKIDRAQEFIVCTPCIDKSVAQFNYVLHEHKTFKPQGRDLVCLISEDVRWRIRQGIIRF